MLNNNERLSLYLGLAVGDALGVPVEFKSRESLAANPVLDMREYGTHHQPKGTWSDDSSMAFCLADAIQNGKGRDLQYIANNFVLWWNDSAFTARGDCFDIGNTTCNALKMIENGYSSEKTGGKNEYDNGNGSLMRILPMLSIINYQVDEHAYQKVCQVSAITHAHPISLVCCNFLCYFVQNLLLAKKSGLSYTKSTVFMESYEAFFTDRYCINVPKEHENAFNHVRDNLSKVSSVMTKEEDIQSSGYVLSTLKASIWCFLNTDSYSEAVLRAVNLGGDTDTTGCVTGGIAGLWYGWESIPSQWLNVLARVEWIFKLSIV